MQLYQGGIPVVVVMAVVLSCPSPTATSFVPSPLWVRRHPFVLSTSRPPYITGTSPAMTTNKLWMVVADNNNDNNNVDDTSDDDDNDTTDLLLDVTPQYGISYIGGDPCGSKYNDDPFDVQVQKPGMPDSMKARIQALVDKKVAEEQAQLQKQQQQLLQQQQQHTLQEQSPNHKGDAQ